MPKAKTSKAERLAQAKKDHERFIKRLGFTGVSSYRPPFPSYKVEDRGLPPTSDRIEAIPTKKDLREMKQEISKQYTVAPAYNKGAYQVIGKKDVKDIGR